MKNLRVRYDKNEHQELFHSDDHSKFLHLNCGFGGGKSYGLVMKALKLSYLNRNIRGGVVCQSIADFKKDLLPLFEDILEENRIKYRYHKSDKWFKFPWSRGELQVASAEKKLRGPNWGYALANEVTLFEHERFKEIIGRVRVKHAPAPQIATSGTPEGTSHWLYERFVEKPMAGSRIIYGDTRANAKNLASDYIQSLMNSYDSVMLDAYLRGMFVNMNSSRFYYAYDASRNEDRNIFQVPGETIHVSMDFNVDPMTCTLWHLLDVTDEKGLPIRDAQGNTIQEALAFGQIMLGGPKGADTNMMAQALKARGCHPDDTIIYPDPAGNSRSTKGASDVQILRNNGFHQIKFKSAAPDFRKRQLNHNNLLEKGRVRIHPSNCPGLKKDYEAVEQDQVTLGKVKDNAKLTHFSDGADYFLDIVFPLSGHKPESRSIKYR